MCRELGRDCDVKHKGNAWVDMIKESKRRAESSVLLPVIER